MAGWDDLGGWLGAGALGLGAAGTGLGIYDMVRANQQAQARDFAAKQWLRQNPPGSFYGQLATPESMQAFARPWLADTAASGVQSGGAWTQAVADAAAKYRSQVYPQSEQMRLNEFQGMFGPYGGYTNQPSAAGALGSAGQSLQMLMLLNALRNRQQPPTQPGAAYSGALPGAQGPQAEQDYAQLWGQNYDIPQYQLYPPGGALSYSPLQTQGTFGQGGGSFYPQEAY